MLIQFGILNYKLLIILLLPFVRQTQKIYYEKHDKANNAFFMAFIDFSAFTFCGLIYLLTKNLTKPDNHKKEEKENENQNEQNESQIKEIELESKDSDDQIKRFVSLKDEIIQSILISKRENLNKIKKQKRKKNLFILLLSGLHILAIIIRNTFRDKINKNLLQHIPALFQIIFLITFSIIFLGYSLYFHQYVSMVLICIYTLIFLLESAIYTEEITNKKFFECLLYYLSYELLYCLSDVLGKKYLNIYIDGVYLFLFKIGITGLIPLLFYDIIAYCSSFDIKYHGIIQTLFIDLPFLNTLSFLFFSVIAIIGIWLVIYYFTPCHFIIIETLGDFINLIYIHFFKNEDEDYNKAETISFIILYPFLIFGVLVFNEIIILNFCRLNHNTKYYILKRAKQDATTEQLLKINATNDNEEERNEKDYDKDSTLY